jgi:hypothetical protein
MITLRNNFHNTKVRVRIGVGEQLSESQLARVRRELCGVSDCACGVVRDEDWVLEPIGSGWGVVARGDW